MIQAIAFDLGDTLMAYEGVPLNWSQHYRAALAAGFERAAIAGTERLFAACEAVLVQYNTRLHPREIEVPAATIFATLGQAIQATPDQQSLLIAAFFGYFQQKSQLFPETVSTLERIKAHGLRTAILTDVAYGMPKPFVAKDIEPFNHLIDITLTSVEVGRRKPSPHGYILLAAHLGCDPGEMVYVGNEAKDIAGAARAGYAQSILINRTPNRLEYGQTHTCANLHQMWELLATAPAEQAKKIFLK